MARILREGTFVLNLDKASADTYQTWVTVRIWSNGLLERKCNETLRPGTGGGQKWVAIGTVEGRDIDLVNASETNARIFATLVKRSGRNCDGSHGAAWCKAVAVKPRRNTQTGRKLTAAPSIREGKPPRDKNVKARRWNAIDINDMAAKIAARK